MSRQKLFKTVFILFLFIMMATVYCPPKTAWAASKPALAPILDYSCLIGGLDEGRWIHSADMAERLSGGETYTIYSLTQKLGEAVGGAPYEGGAGLMVDVSKTPESDLPFVALGAAHNAMPRVPKLTNTSQEIYNKEIAQILKQNSLASAPVKITQIIRIDLEGDGKEEVLVSASNIPDQFQTLKNSYTIVLLRKIVKGKVQTTILEEEYHVQDEENGIPTWCDVRALLDIDGDGAQEIINSCSYYEGGGLTVYKIMDGRARHMLSDGCGV